MKPAAKWRSEVMNAVAAAVIALLIWAYANDRTRESASVAGTVRLAPADPRVQFVEPSTAVSLAVEVRGSRRAIEAFEDVLRSGLPLATGGDGLPAEAGTHAASFREVLAANPTVIATGAEVLRVRPESLRFEVGSLVTEQVPIAVVLPNAAVRGEIFADPQVVTVTLPEVARKSIGALSVDAAIDTKNLEAGKPQQIDVELRLPSTLDRWKELCRVVPPRARISFELLASSNEYTAPRIAVRITLSPQTASRWDVTVVPGSEFMTGVVLTGPRAAIDSITTGAFTPAAVIDLDETPVKVGTAEYPVTFWRLPEGVTVVKKSGDAAPTTATLRLLPRDPAVSVKPITPTAPN